VSMTLAQGLAELRDSGVRMIVRCGRCKRRFGSASVHWRDPVVVIEGVAQKGGMGYGPVSLGQSGPAPDPSVIKVNGRSVNPRPNMSVEQLDDGRRRYLCDRRCGARWVVSEEQILRAFIRTANAGRGDLVFGDNL
jgi:hypothetical protein